MALKVFFSLLIGRCDYFGFGLWHVIKKRSLCARQDALVKETTRWIYRGNDSLTVLLVAISWRSVIMRQRKWEGKKRANQKYAADSPFHSGLSDQL